jgi:hypothetical protein
MRWVANELGVNNVHGLVEAFSLILHLARLGSGGAPQN